MSFVAAAASVGAAVGLSGTAAVIGGGMLIGAGVGAAGAGLYSAVTGDGDVGQSMLYGGLGGAALGGGAAAAMPAAGAAAGATVPVSGAVAAPAAEGIGGLASTDAAAFGPGWSSAGFNGGAGAGGAGAVGDVFGGYSATGSAAGTAGTTMGGAGGANVAAGGAGVTAGGAPVAGANGYGAAGSAGKLAATTQGGLTGGDVLLGTLGLGALMQADNSRYGVPSNQGTYDGPLNDFTYSRENYTPYTAAPPSPAYQPAYANYVKNPYNPYAAEGGKVVSMAGGGIANASQNNDGAGQMFQNNGVAQNQIYPQSTINSDAFSNATNVPIAQNIVSGTSDTNVDPYSGAEKFAVGGIAATPQARAQIPVTPQFSPNQITNNSVNFNNDMMARLQGAINSPAVQQSLTQNPLQQAPVRNSFIQAQPYAAPTFTRPTVAPIEFGNAAVTIPGSTAYAAKQKADAEAEAARQAAMYTPPSDNNSYGGGANGGLTQSYAAGGKATSNMAAIDNYITQYNTESTGPATVAAKAKAGDWNAMLAMNKIKGTPNQNYAAGGHLGSYSDGGRMLKGPGDGMSDNIPATIGGKQPARLADGEFVVPADVVSHLGNGSTDAGAKHLYNMMDKVRKARTGTKKQGKQIKPEKFLKG